MTEGFSIQKLSAARLMLSKAKSMDDILRIRDIAEAARTYAQVARLGLQTQNEAAEVKLRAERMAGQVLAVMEKNQGGRPSETPSTMEGVFAPPLADLGIGYTQAHRWQQVASLAETTFEEYIAQTRDSDKELTSVGAVRLAKFEAAKDKPLPPPMAGKYRVIYADPPWRYGDKLVDGYGPAEFHYPTMSIDDLSALPVWEIVEDDAVLFLWVTSPLLEESFQVVKAWGFQYKSSFVWDKIKHNLGHYNSVRHEFLFVCVRGSCQPDVMKLFDSVQTIERTEHSAKPEEFRNIIDTIYPNGKRIELFARKRVPNWEVWGNESDAT